MFGGNGDNTNEADGDDAKIVSRGAGIDKDLQGHMETYATTALSSINILETVPKILTDLGAELKNLVSLEATLTRLIYLD